MKKMFFDVLLSKLFYKEKVDKFQQIYGKMGGVANREQRSRSRSRRGGVSENQIAGAARLFFLTAVAIAIATRPFKFHEISVSNTSSSFVSSIHSFEHHRVGRVLSFFSSRRTWDSPNPSPAGECAPPPHRFWGERHTLAGERGVGRVPIPTRGHTLWYSLYVRTLCTAHFYQIFTIFQR